MTKIVAEIGTNHCGRLDKAIEMIHMAARAGADMVKFQKRSPSLAVPENEWKELRCTPFGIMSKLDYRKKVEFDIDDYLQIDKECQEADIKWFVSVWDMLSLKFIYKQSGNYQAMANIIKIPSARMMAHDLQVRALYYGFDLIVSTGMHRADEINTALDHLMDWARRFRNKIVVMHCNSQYPTDDEDVNLEAMNTLSGYMLPVGFSSHSQSPLIPIHAISFFQPEIVEVHITLDRAGPASDDSSSLEEKGLAMLVRERNRFYNIVGDGKLRLYKSEMPARRKLKVR